MSPDAQTPDEAAARLRSLIRTILRPEVEKPLSQQEAARLAWPWRRSDLGTCGQGGCNREASEVRWSRDHRAYLPVCFPCSRAALAPTTPQEGTRG
ncbi:hypothetical protein PSD17_55270 [Pseudonocardia sp. D17]|nr:hypothetical protein PSD17_55270 [Pseudonocardia sp. D17]